MSYTVWQSAPSSFSTEACQMAWKVETLSPAASLHSVHPVQQCMQAFASQQVCPYKCGDVTLENIYVAKTSQTIYWSIV